MARTPSNMLALNTPAPDFGLIELASGRTVRLADFQRTTAAGRIHLQPLPLRHSHPSRLCTNGRRIPSTRRRRGRHQRQ